MTTLPCVAALGTEVSPPTRAFPGPDPRADSGPPGMTSLAPRGVSSTAVLAAGAVGTLTAGSAVSNLSETAGRAASVLLTLGSHPTAVRTAADNVAYTSDLTSEA